MKSLFLMRILLLITICVVQQVVSGRSTPLVSGGNETIKGQFPWFVSLHKKMRSGKDKFFCSASLINEWTLVTAAHCIKEEHLKAQFIRAHLGRLDITDDTEEGIQLRDISAIKIHKNYGNTSTADSDIAILFLNESVTFSEFIEPIKLPTSTDDITSKIGTVVGYGKINQNSSDQAIPIFAKLRVSSLRDCYFSNDVAPETLAKNSFCAKSDVSVPCKGDSGGPFMVEDDDDVWKLFGIVSHAFDDECNARDFAVFTDVSKFVDWIWSHLFACKDRSRRVPWVNYCDGVSDCADGSDEKHCVSGKVRKGIFEPHLLTFDVNWTTTIDNEDFGIASARNENIERFYEEYNWEIKFLPIGVAEKFPNLKEFHVYGCSFPKISRANFKNLKKLENLFLKVNEITSIEAGSFDDLTSLKVLNLGDNLISSLPENAFEHLKDLRQINLFKNQLKSLPAQLFKNNRKLEEIHLGENRIEEIPPNFFAGLTELEYLWLDNNQISIFPTNLFKDLTKLRQIGLNNNKLKVLSKEIFQFNKKLEKIVLRSNQLEKIDTELFDGMENLKDVALEGNKCIDKRFGDRSSTSTLNLLELKNEIKAKCT